MNLLRSHSSKFLDHPPHLLNLLTLILPSTRALPSVCSLSIVGISVYGGDQIQPGVYPTSTSCEDRRERERERERERAVRFESVRQWKGRDGDRRGGHRTAPLSSLPQPLHHLHPPTLRDSQGYQLSSTSPSHWEAGGESDCRDQIVAGSFNTSQSSPYPYLGRYHINPRY